MGALARAFKRSREAKASPTLEELRAIDQASFLDQTLNTLLTPLRLLGEAVETVDAPTRAALANIAETFGRTPIERTGRETVFGTAPTGRELIGLGTGEKGTFESGDIAGFAAEAIASPLNFLSALKLTRAGEIASRASSLGRSAKALRAAGRLEDARALLPEIRGLRAAAREAGVSRRLGATLGEQAKMGQRSLLSFSPIFSRLNEPLVPQGLNIPALQALGGVGRFARGTLPARAASAAYRELFAPGGRTGNVLYDELIDLRQQLVREGRRIGQEEFDRSLKFVRGVDVKRAERDLLSLASAAEGPVADAVRTVEQRYQKLIEKAVEDGNIGRAERLQKLMERATQGLRNFIPSKRDPRIALLQVGLHQRDVAGRTVKEIARIQEDTAKAITAHQAEIGKELDALDRIQASARDVAADASFHPIIRQQQADIAREADAKIGKLHKALQRKVERLRSKTAEKVLALQSHSDVAEAVMRSLPPDFQQEVNRIGLLLGQSLRIEQASGVRVSELVDPLLSYVPRIPTRAGIEWARGLRVENPFSSFARTYSTNQPFTKQRVAAFRGLGITQINDLAREMGFKGEFFTEDIGEAVLRRLTDSGRARGTAHMLQGVTSLFSLPADLAGKGGMKVADFLERANITRVGGILGLRKSSHAIAAALKGTKFEGAVIPHDIADAALNFQRVFEHGPTLKTMLSFIDQAHSLWRFSVTQLFPSFHARNQVANWFMMWLGGMRNPAWLAKAAALQRRAAKGTLTGAERKLLAEAGDYASVGMNLASETRALAHATDTTGGSFAGPLNALERFSEGVRGRTGLDLRRGVKGLMQVGGALEDNSKIAMYLWARSKGMSRIEAGRLVKKFLFDYEDLSRFEKDYLRRISAFYTYTRKAFPLLMEQLFTNTRSMRLYGLATGSIGDRSGDRGTLLPPWLADRDPFDFGVDENGNRVFVSAGLPTEELNLFSPEGGGASTIGRKLLNRLAPLPRFIIEESTGTDLLRGKPLRGIDTERDLVGGLPEGVRRELGSVFMLERFLPTSRLTSTLRGGLDALQSEEPGKATDFLTSSLLGVNVRRLQPDAADLQVRLDLANKALARAEQIGAMDRAKLLRSGIARLRRDLQKTR